MNEEQLHRALVLKLERTLDQDVAYGIRMLVDIAERSLADSPLQDPTTTVQAIDRIHDLCVSSFADRSRTAGTATMPARSGWSCRRCRGRPTCSSRPRRSAWPGGIPPVTRRLKAALLDLGSSLHRIVSGPFDRQLELLTAATQSAFDDERDLEVALGSDGQGIGPDAARK